MKYISIFMLVLLVSCNSSGKPKKENSSTVKEKKDVISIERPVLNLEQANRLAALPLSCVNTEYPNKLGQILVSEEDLKTPKQLHPTFYGCFDWHSSVHGHWSLVALLRKFPNLENSDAIKMKLLMNISKENIEKELAYFKKGYNYSFERTYGWAWLLKLREEIHMWDDPVAKKLAKNLKPLADFIAQEYIEYLPKLDYPIRVGEHSNTAFGLNFAWDYAKMFGHKELETLIKKKAKELYLKDANCPLSWEPSGHDFLSPCLEEAALMKRVLSESQFRLWFSDFLPQLKNPAFTLKVAKVSDRKDGKLVHLDGLNFSRAWNLLKITEHMLEYNHLRPIAYQHINSSLPNVFGDNYEGGHWLGSFAIYALDAVERRN